MKDIEIKAEDTKVSKKKVSKKVSKKVEKELNAKQLFMMKMNSNKAKYNLPLAYSEEEIAKAK